MRFPCPHTPLFRLGGELIIWPSRKISKTCRRSCGGVIKSESITWSSATAPIFWCATEEFGAWPSLLARGFLGVEEVEGGPEKKLILAEAGGPLGKLVEFSLRKGLTGLEFAAGIPGTVGGAIFMNAGAFRGEMKGVLHAVRLMDAQGYIAEKEKNELKFSYRFLELGKGEIILGGKFHLLPENGRRVGAKVEENFRWRKARQPWHLPSAGSVFKNPVQGPAGKFIEETGLKGLRIGDAQVSEQHANFIVNRGKARAQDILSLVEMIREKVFQEKGVWLEMEIQVVGED